MIRLIDANALIDAMYAANVASAYEAQDIINSAPTIDAVSVVHGEWIRDRYWSRGVGMGEDYGFFYKCSLCEYEVESGYTRCGFNFCPYCGAKMKGADDERHNIDAE